MLSDFRTMQSDYPTITGSKVAFDANWVPDWIKAYFHSIEDFKEWVSQNHTKYTVPLLTAIVETSSFSSREKEGLRTFIRSTCEEHM